MPNTEINIQQNPLNSDSNQDSIKEESLDIRMEDSRKRNREAVARSRAKKSLKIQKLQSIVDNLCEEKSILSQKLAISQIEKEAAESRKNDLKLRIHRLEEMILIRESHNK